jgi:hypothetical protein
MVLNLVVKVHYGGTYQPTIREAQAVRREARGEESVEQNRGSMYKNLKFFDTVNQDKLIGLIMKTVKDGEVVSLIRKFLVSGVMEKGHYQPTKIGTPQGGNLSPLLSNIMLNELDKELEARGLNFVRYADDCMIFVKS